MRKIVFMDGDGHPVGAKGTILGSVGPAFVPELGREVYGYFIEWDEGPGRGLPCFVSDFKIAPEEGK